MIAQTASEAYIRYQDFLARDALVQSSWHIEKDGRQLACALGVLGDEITGVAKCPAQVMPRWLAQHVIWFFDGQNFDDAKDWGARFYAELARVNGNVPFSVVHDWQADFVCPWRSRLPRSASAIPRHMPPCRIFIVVRCRAISPTWKSG